MTKLRAIWKGQSGKRYTYNVWSTNGTWNDVPGNYIFARRTTNGWVAAYIGQTKSFKTRLPRHEEWTCAKRNGATHVHARVNRGGEAARKTEEKDLVARYKPPCNKHHK